VQYIVIFIVILFLPSNALAKKWKPYVSLSGGFHLPKKAEFYQFDKYETHQSSYGLAILTSFGLRKRSYRFELEYGFRFSSYQIPTLDMYRSLIEVASTTTSLIANAYYHLPKEGFLRPYFGLGAGAVRQTVKTLNPKIPYENFYPSNPSSPLLAHHFAWQGMFGTTIKLSRSFSSDLEYRYFSGGTIKAHGSNINLRYSF